MTNADCFDFLLICHHQLLVSSWWCLYAVTHTNRFMKFFSKWSYDLIAVFEVWWHWLYKISGAIVYNYRLQRCMIGLKILLVSLESSVCEKQVPVLWFLMWINCLIWYLWFFTWSSVYISLYFDLYNFYLLDVIYISTGNHDIYGFAEFSLVIVLLLDYVHEIQF